MDLVLLVFELCCIRDRSSMWVCAFVSCVCVCVCVEIVFECDVMCLWLCWCCVVGAWPLSLSLLQVSVVLMHASFRALCCVAIVVGCLSSPLHASGMFLHAGFRA